MLLAQNDDFVVMMMLSAVARQLFLQSSAWEEAEELRQAPRALTAGFRGRSIDATAAPLHATSAAREGPDDEFIDPLRLCQSRPFFGTLGAAWAAAPSDHATPEPHPAWVSVHETNQEEVP